MSPAGRHNAAVYPILREILRRVGPEPRELLVVAESVVVGLFLLIVKLGGDEPVLEVFAAGVAARLAQMRLGAVDPKGQA